MFATYQPSFAPIWASDFLESESPDYLHLAHLRQARQQQYERQVAQRLAAEEHRRQQKRQQQEEAEEQLAFLMHAARARAAQAQADLERRRRAAQLQQQQMRERERARRMMALEQGRRAAAVAAAAYNPYRNGTSRRPLAGGERYRYSTSRRSAGLEYSSPNCLDLIGDLFTAGIDSQHDDDDNDQPEHEPEEEVDISQLLYRLLGQREHVDEQVELKHKTPARNEEVVHVVADPEEVDLAAAVFAAVTEDDAATVPSASEESGSDADVSDDESTLDLSEASLEQLSRLADDFVSHRRDFVSPTILAFQSTSSAEAGRSPTPPLAFGSTNAAFLGYEDYLVTLLSKIDAVESHGVPQVKKARKQLVKQVEQELARLDHLKDSAWEEQSGHSSASDSDSMSEDASPEAVEVLTVDSESDSDSSHSDASTLEDDHPSVSSPAPENESLAVKIPFLPATPRDVSPALSNASSSSSTLNAGDDDIAEILLAARRLGDKVQQLEEFEREQQELAELAHSGASDSEEMDDEEDVYFMYF